MVGLSIGRGEIEGGAKPPGIAGTTINIPPFGVLLWDNQEVPPGATTIIDTFGYSNITLFIEVDKPARITLAEVSYDGINWRHVGELIKVFGTPYKTFLSLNEETRIPEIFLYRYLKLRVDSEVFVKITLEATSKFIGIASILYDILYTTAGNLPERIREIIKEKEIVEKNALLTELEGIHELLETRFTNPATWVHDQKDVNTPGTPVQLFSIGVPDGYALVVKAKRTNTGNIYTGNSYNNAKDTARQVPLAANESNRLYVKNAEEVWIDADVAKEGVVYWTEKRKWF